jgi:glycine/D-amino acid oxidase-like deaminating enzyme
VSDTVSDTASFDIAIVGGGLVGAAIAYGLSGLGGRVVVLDEGDRAHRASRGNFGLVWVQGKGAGLPAYGSWTQVSARLWPKLAADLAAATGIDVALAQPGGAHLCLSKRELDHRIAKVEALVAQSGFERYPIDVLDHDALARRLPGLGPDVVGGTWSALDGHCNPLRLLDALHAGCRATGVAYRPGAAVRAVAARGNAFTLDTVAGPLHAERVVLAAGLGNAKLAPMVGLRAPVVPNQGQIIALERVQPFLAAPVETLRQTDDGTVLVGDAQRDVGHDETLAIDVLATMADRAVRMFPALAGVRVVRAWAALRVMSPDGFPIYAQSRRHPGAFVATCHSGVTLAAAHAYRLAPAIRDGALPREFDAYSHERFDDLAAA